jgi:hypothetical protein
MRERPFLLRVDDKDVVINCEDNKMAEKLKIVLEALLVRGAYVKPQKEDEDYLAGPS